MQQGEHAETGKQYNLGRENIVVFGAYCVNGEVTGS